MKSNIKNREIVDFSISKQIKNGEFWSKNIDQNYHPSGYFGEESKRVVYSKGLINLTKFFPILLKEWFFVLKKNGYLVIDYVPNKVLDFESMEKSLWWLCKQRYDLIYHGRLNSSSNILKKIRILKSIPIQSNNNYFRIICKKTHSTKIIGDSINKWTFGIVSDGARQEWVDLIIKSIKNQKIPQYEIIICGKYYGKKAANIEYIPFTFMDNKGWITKKKNLIIKLASYQNVCLVHDRYIFDNDWYKKTKEYGNSFEYLTNIQIYKNIRAGDWVTLGGREFAAHKTRLIDYRDWDKYVIISGGHIISKKNILNKVPFNESLYWNRAEDVQLGHDMMDSGFIPRINSAKVNVLSFRFGRLPFKPFGKKIYWPDMPLRRFLTTLAALVNFIPGMHTLLYNFSKNTGIYKIFYRM